jgi:hypothetical protein
MPLVDRGLLVQVQVQVQVQVLALVLVQVPVKVQGQRVEWVALRPAPWVTGSPWMLTVTTLWMG